MSPERPPSSGGDRKKWEAGVLLVPSVAQQTLEQTSFTTIGEKLQWLTPPPAPAPASLLTSSASCSSEHTAGVVSQLCGRNQEGPRKAWPVKPDSQVLRVLQEAELQTLTQELANVSLCEEDTHSPG